jgi:hypothetical protein
LSKKLKDFLFELLSEVPDAAELDEDGTYYVNAKKLNYIGYISKETLEELDVYLDTLCKQ